MCSSLTSLTHAPLSQVQRTVVIDGDVSAVFSKERFMEALHEEQTSTTTTTTATAAVAAAAATVSPQPEPASPAPMG